MNCPMSILEMLCPKKMPSLHINCCMLSLRAELFFVIRYLIFAAAIFCLLPSFCSIYSETHATYFYLPVFATPIIHMHNYSKTLVSLCYNDMHPGVHTNISSPLNVPQKPIILLQDVCFRYCPPHLFAAVDVPRQQDSQMEKSPTVSISSQPTSAEIMFSSVQKSLIRFFPFSPETHHKFPDAYYLTFNIVCIVYTCT